MKLANRVAIVTGAAGSIGQEFAQALADEGALLVLMDLQDCSQTAAQIRSKGGSAIDFRGDVSNQEDIDRLIETTLTEFGRIDILVNNAAILAGLEFKSFMDIDNDAWDRVMRVNARGPFQMIKSVAPHMKENSYGKIINIASSTVFKGLPFVHYICSKAALISLTKSVARELGKYNICCNAISVGFTKGSSTEILPDDVFDMINNMSIGARSIKKTMTPDDLTGALTFLASKDSDFITGQTFIIDGGDIMP